MFDQRLIRNFLKLLASLHSFRTKNSDALSGMLRYVQCSPRPFPGLPPLRPFRTYGPFAIMCSMSVGELARFIGRSVDTIKRWEKTGLLSADRDNLGRRRFNSQQIERGVQLGKLALEAQRTSTSLAQLAIDREPPMLPLVNKVS